MDRAAWASSPKLGSVSKLLPKQRRGGSWELLLGPPVGQAARNAWVRSRSSAFRSPPLGLLQAGCLGTWGGYLWPRDTELASSWGRRLSVCSLQASRPVPLHCPSVLPQLPAAALGQGLLGAQDQTSGGAATALPSSPSLSWLLTESCRKKCKTSHDFGRGLDIVTR